MTCPYYKWRSNFFGGDYYCTKKESEVNDDIYKRYCRDYSYSDCPIYKGSSDSGGCYLTTACVVSKGLPDDCHELETLRKFRDSYLKPTEEGAKLVEEYYALAPRIVSRINESKERKTVYDGLYEKVIAPCVALIEQGCYEETKDLYCKMVLTLQEKYAS